MYIYIYIIYIKRYIYKYIYIMILKTHQKYFAFFTEGLLTKLCKKRKILLINKCVSNTIFLCNTLLNGFKIYIYI